MPAAKQYTISQQKKVGSQQHTGAAMTVFRYNKKKWEGSESMKVAVCDDEKGIRELIGNKIRTEYPEAEIIFCESGEELLLLDDRIDILFLDIQMEGRNGMETARALRAKNEDTILIFVTALAEYVFQAFDVGAFHYLVKPFEDEKFREVLRKAVKQLPAYSVRESGTEEKHIMINNGGIHIKIMLDSIIYAEVFNRKVVIHRIDSDIEYYGKMSELERMVGEDFFRPHRAYLVNLKYVEKYDASTIYLEKGTALMAKQKFPEFVKRYMKYNQRKG